MGAARGQDVPCPAAKSRIELDGKLDDPAWTGATTTSIDDVDHVHESYRKGWSGPADLSAKVRALVSRRALYLGIDVTDDAVLTQSGPSWWIGDSIEVFLDTELGGAEDDGAYSDDDHQLFLLPFHDGLRWGVVGRGPAARYPDGGLHGIEVARTRRQGGYVVEARIPLSNFPRLRPDDKGRIGFDIALNDVDREGQEATESYMTLSGRFELFSTPENFARLVIGDVRPMSGVPLPAGSSLDWWGLGLRLAGVALLAVLLLALVRRIVKRSRLRLLTLCGLSAAAAGLLSFLPTLAAVIDGGAVRGRWRDAVEGARTVARGHHDLDAAVGEERTKRLFELFRDGRVRIRPHYRYHFLRLTKSAALPRYAIGLQPGAGRSFPLEGIAAPQELRLFLQMPKPDAREDAGLPAAEIRLEFEEGPALTVAPRRNALPVRIDTGERAGTPLRSLHVRNLLSHRSIQIQALQGGAPQDGALLPLATLAPSGVPLDVWRDTPATHIARVRKGTVHRVEPVGIAAHRLWIAVGTEGAYPRTPYGEEVAVVRVYHAGAQQRPGVELRLRNGVDVQDNLLAYAQHTGGAAGIALEWENHIRVPTHYSLHALDLDPTRPVERIEIEDLGVLESLRVAAATMGVRAIEAPPRELFLRGDRLEVREEVRALWQGLAVSVGAYKTGPASGVAIPVDGTVTLHAPRSGWAQALLDRRTAIFGVAAVFLALAAVLAGAALLQRARHLRVKMLVALGAATVAPLLFLVVGLTTLLNERAESDLRDATRADLRGMHERVSGAKARARDLATRVRDTLEFVVPRGPRALSRQIRRTRDEMRRQGAVLRLPELDPKGPSPMGNTSFVDTIARSGLYYSPWDGLMALGIARTGQSRRYLLALGPDALLGLSPSPDVTVALYPPEGEARSLRAYEAHSLVEGRSVAAAHETLRDGGRVVGVLGVYRSRASTDGTKAAIFQTLLVSGLAALLLVVLAGGTLADRVTDRLRRLTRAARSMAQGDLGTRVPQEGEDEVGRLASSFNTMADALDERVGQLTDLHRGLQSLTGALDRDQVAHAAVELLERASGAKRIVVAAFDRATERIEPLDRLGEGAPLDDGLAREAIATREPVLREGAAYLPLMASGGVVGVAGCSRVERELDGTFLETIGRQIGIALENARLYRDAVTDELTGLYTHAFFVRRLKEEVDRASATGRPLSLLRLVIDGYAATARRHGAAVAAKIVAETAAVLEQTLPRRNMVARREGGELLALLVESDERDARRHIDRVAAALLRCDFALRGDEPRPTVTYRSVTYPRDGAAADILLDSLFLEETESLDGTDAEQSVPLKVPPGLGVVLGTSATMRAAFEVVARVAPTTAGVLLSGETGSGKEVLADLIQANSDRRGPYVKINCAAIPENLVEAELFGHEKGAFTGAERRRTGRFEEAHRGTLFLDEIGDLSVPMQVKFLRVLQDRCVRRVGGSTPVAVDVRIIAASNRDLAEAVRRHEFREDLYHRLHVIALRVPPLRERREDIPRLADHFRREFNRRHGLALSTIEPDAMDALYSYLWPGNVRELRNVLERAMLLAGGTTLERGHLSLPEADGEEPGPVRVEGLTPRQERILALARSSGGVTNSEVVAKEAVSARTALRELQRLVDRGLLVRVGRRRGAVYRPRS